MPGLTLRIRGQTAVHVNLQRHLMNSADASRTSRTAHMHAAGLCTHASFRTEYHAASSAGRTSASLPEP